MIVKVFFVLSALSNLCECANILAIIPTPSYSHQIAFRELWKQLSMRGHKITLITTDPMNDSTLENLKEIDMSISYKILNEKYKFDEQAQDGFSYWNTWEFFLYLLSEVLQHQLSQPEIQTLINDKDNFKFDLLMLELYFHELLIFGKIYNCPSILLGTIGSTLEISSSFGNNFHPAMNYDLNFPFAGKLSYFERILSTLYFWNHMFLIQTKWIPKKQHILNRFFNNGTTFRVADLMSDSDLLLINESPLLKGIQALGPTTISVGGSNHLEPPKPLPQVCI